MIKITIPLPPITKKNSQQILTNNNTGKKFIAPSEQYKQYEQKALWYIPKLRQPHPINRPVNVKCLFYMPTRRKCDLTNLLESIDDILVKARLLADDNYTIIESHDGSRVYYDKENPRTEIYITDPREETKVAYICDLQKCNDCNYPTCKHTTDIQHAKNFENNGGHYMEKEKKENA